MSAPEPTLQSLTVVPGQLSGFSPSRKIFTLYLPHSVDSVVFTPTASDPSARLTVNGTECASGAPMPPWLKRVPSPGINDGLRRLVLVPRAGEAGPLPVTAWLAPEEDLEPARRELGAALGLPPA